MKETLSEYARITIVMISFALMCAFILGGTWFNRLGQTSNTIENEIVQDRQMTVLEQLEERQIPTLIVNGETFKTGTVIKLTDLIEEATTLAENGTDKIDIKERVTIVCNSKDYIEESKSLLPTNAGVYEAKFSVQDDYGLSTTVLVKIVVVDKS